MNRFVRRLLQQGKEEEEAPDVEEPVGGRVQSLHQPDMRLL